MTNVPFEMVECSLCRRDDAEDALCLYPEWFGGSVICVFCGSALITGCPGFEKFVNDLDAFVVEFCQECGGSGKCVYIQESSSVCIPCLGSGRKITLKPPLVRLAEQA